MGMDECDGGCCWRREGRGRVRWRLMLAARWAWTTVIVAAAAGGEIRVDECSGGCCWRRDGQVDECDGGCFCWWRGGRGRVRRILLLAARWAWASAEDAAAGGEMGVDECGGGCCWRLGGHGQARWRLLLVARWLANSRAVMLLAIAGTTQAEAPAPAAAGLVAPEGPLITGGERGEGGGCCVHEPRNLE